MNYGYSKPTTKKTNAGIAFVALSVFLLGHGVLISAIARVCAV